jgi:hypothetical protein
VTHYRLRRRSISSVRSGDVAGLRRALRRAGQLLVGYQGKLADQSLERAARARAKVASDAIAAAMFSA